MTPVIGREYSTTYIVNDLLKAQNADDLLRGLAITSDFSLKVIGEYIGSVPIPIRPSEDQNANKVFTKYRSEVLYSSEHKTTSFDNGLN